MSRNEPSDVSSLHARLVWFGLALHGRLVRLGGGHVDDLLHSLGSHYSRFPGGAFAGPPERVCAGALDRIDLSQGGVERGMRPLLNAGHDPVEYVAIARAVGVDPYVLLAQAENEVGGRRRRIDLTLCSHPVDGRS